MGIWCLVPQMKSHSRSLQSPALISDGEVIPAFLLAPRLESLPGPQPLAHKLVRGPRAGLSLQGCMNELMRRG